MPGGAGVAGGSQLRAWRVNRASPASSRDAMVLPVRLTSTWSSKTAPTMARPENSPRRPELRSRRRPLSSVSPAGSASASALPGVLADMRDACAGSASPTATRRSTATSLSWRRPCAWSFWLRSSSRPVSSSPLPSSPYCPPSHERWRASQQCTVANRLALHSDYYNATKKASTLLRKSPVRPEMPPRCAHAFAGAASGRESPRSSSQPATVKTREMAILSHVLSMEPT